MGWVGGWGRAVGGTVEPGRGEMGSAEGRGGRFRALGRRMEGRAADAVGWGGQQDGGAIEDLAKELAVG